MSKLCPALNQFTIANLLNFAKMLSTRNNKKKAISLLRNGLQVSMRPTGIELVSSAPQADTLSIELWARKLFSLNSRIRGNLLLQKLLLNYSNIFFYYFQTLIRWQPHYINGKLKKRLWKLAGVFGAVVLKHPRKYFPWGVCKNVNY